MSQFAYKLEHWIHRVSRAVNLVGVIILFLMMLAIVTDVSGRFLLNQPLEGSIDIVELMMVILVFSSAAYCALLEGHIRVDVIYSRLSKRIKAILDCITFAASAFIFALIFWRLAARAWQIMLDQPGPVTMNIDIPHWPFLFLASAGSLIFCLELLIYFFHSLARVK